MDGDLLVERINDGCIAANGNLNIICEKNACFVLVGVFKGDKFMNEVLMWF